MAPLHIRPQKEIHSEKFDQFRRVSAPARIVFARRARQPSFALQLAPVRRSAFPEKVASVVNFGVISKLESVLDAELLQSRLASRHVLDQSSLASRHVLESLLFPFLIVECCHSVMLLRSPCAPSLPCFQHNVQVYSTFYHGPWILSRNLSIGIVGNERKHDVRRRKCASRFVLLRPSLGSIRECSMGLPCCPSENLNAQMDASGSVPLSSFKKKFLLEFCSVEADTWIFLCWYALRRGSCCSTTRPWLRPNRPDLQWHDCSSGGERVQEVV